MTRDRSVLRVFPRHTGLRLLAIRPLLEEALAPRVWGEDGHADPYEAILQALHRLVRVEAVSLLLYDGSQEKLCLRAATGLHTIERPEERYDVAGSLSGAALCAPGALTANDVTADVRSTRKWVNWWSDHLPSSRLVHGTFVPVRGDVELQGVLRFFNRLLPDGSVSLEGFDEQDRQILELIGRLAAVQLNQVWMAERLGIISESIGEQGKHATMQDVADHIAKTGARLADAAAATVFLPDPVKPSFLRLVGSHGFRHRDVNLTIPIDHSVIGRALFDNRPVLEEDLQTSTKAFAQGPGRREGMASLVALRLASAPPPGTVTGEDGAAFAPGVLVVYAKLKRRFQQSTCNLLGQFAVAAGSVIDSRSRAIESQELRDVIPLVAHSVRGPLERVLLALAKISAKDGRAKVFAQEIADARQSLEITVSRLETMLLSRKGLIEVMRPEFSRVKVPSLLADCVERFTPLAREKSRDIKLRGDFIDFPRISADADKLQLVIDNLLENAIKYCWKGELISVLAEKTGDSVRISVMDRGLGIPEEMQESIFDSFVRSHVLDRRRHIRGTGLGLYVSKLIVEAHGGTIRVKSAPFLNDPARRLAQEGYETTFIVSLPIRRPD